MQDVGSKTHNQSTENKTESVLASFAGNRFTLKIVDATVALPNKLILLRDDVLVSELAMLSPDELLTSNDRFGIHVLLFENETERLIGATHVAPAEQILFMHYAGFDARELSTSVLARCSVIAKNFRGQGFLNLLLSAAANFFVRRGRSNIITYLPEDGLLLQRRFYLTPVQDGVARKEHLQSGQTISFKPFFILFEHLLHLEVKESKHFDDLIYEIQGFDWFSQNSDSVSSFKIPDQNFSFDGK